MSTKETPGQALVAALSRQLPPGMEWDEKELATLDLISAAADRLAVLRRRFAALARDPASTPNALASLQTACHQLEGDLFRWGKSLDPRNDTAKSMRHVAAANARWHPVHGTG